MISGRCRGATDLTDINDMNDSPEQGLTVYLVGGAVRDGLLGRPVAKRDWVVVGSDPEEMLHRGFTLVGRDSESVPAANIGDREFGILFADNTDGIRLANVLIANFRHGCFEAEGFADLGAISPGLFTDSYLDGVHCANEAGPNPTAFGIVRDDALGFAPDVVAPNNSNEDGLVYYNGAGGELPSANTTFVSAAGGINFTGEIVERPANFTAG